MQTEECDSSLWDPLPIVQGRYESAQKGDSLNFCAAPASGQKVSPLRRQERELCPDGRKHLTQLHLTLGSVLIGYIAIQSRIGICATHGIAGLLVQELRECIFYSSWRDWRFIQIESDFLSFLRKNLSFDLVFVTQKIWLESRLDSVWLGWMKSRHQH